MKTLVSRAAATFGAVSFVLSAIPATAQDHRRDNDRDQNDGGQRPDQNDWGQHRDSDRHDQGGHRWHNYGGQYGYNGYRGHWRTGQRYTHYNNDHYVISDYRAYNLPPPRPGYRYYRDDNGDVVMAAIAGGIIGLILGSATNGNHYNH
jgi:Ni/Co efflux regulator RcnB